jgi:hypothetical protein
MGREGDQLCSRLGSKGTAPRQFTAANPERSGRRQTRIFINFRRFTRAAEEEGHYVFVCGVGLLGIEEMNRA